MSADIDSRLAAARPVSGEAIRVRGLVQGVGFRPTVWRLATECGLNGEVRNDGAGVAIHAWGSDAARERFLARLRAEVPPLARIDSLTREALAQPPPGAPGFRIAESAGGAVRTGVVPDAATCPACLAELRDPEDRRYGYAFTNCTHCGPRLTIVRAIPYDRARTSMAAFPLCGRCAAEYADPADRRFHAQPNACPDCGPRPWLAGAHGDATTGDPIEAAAGIIAAGGIVAVKGLGGFHLAADATDQAAVARLRARKRRYDKPFALMARDMAVIRRYARVSEAERVLLESPAAPVVVLDTSGGERVADTVAPGQRSLGFMLPYTPLHHRLLAGRDTPIVLTSGNRCEEPQCTDNDEARERLADIADALLLHDRGIESRVDDSVCRVMAGAARPLRRARGYAPSPLALPDGLVGAPPLLAMGGELKNTFCLVRDGDAFLSQHIGDLEDARTHGDYRRNLALYRTLFEHQPRAVAVDAHPDYLSTKLGREIAEREGLPVLRVQHHHAHVAACLADNAVALDAVPVLGMALDGLGYGDDGTIWGGELLDADYRGYARVARLGQVPMPGGAQAIREPWRMAYAHIRAALDWTRFARDYASLPLAADFERRPLATLAAMIERGVNCPMTSSCGRLFDAVAAAVGICRDRAGYEGQAAVELEALIDAAALDAAGDGYTLGTRAEPGLTVLETASLWPALLDDLARGERPAVVAARFHRGLARALVALADRLARRSGMARPVALTGGVFQNRRLFEDVTAGLERRGLTVLAHARVPANDGGLALGQAAVAAARLTSGDSQEAGPCA